MPLPYAKPDKALHRELRAVARLAHDLERSIKESNVLPEDFPAKDVADLILVLEALPEGTAEGCKEPLRYAQERLAEIGRDHIQIEDDDEDARDASGDPDALPALGRGGGIDQAVTKLIGAIAYACSEYERQAGEAREEDDGPERPVRPDAEQAAELADLERQAGEIGVEAADFGKQLDNRDQFHPSDSVDTLRRQGRDAETHLDLVRQAARQPVVKPGVLARLGEVLAKLPAAVEATWRGLRLAVDLTEIGVSTSAISPPSRVFYHSSIYVGSPTKSSEGCASSGSPLHEMAADGRRSRSSATLMLPGAPRWWSSRLAGSRWALSKARQEESKPKARSMS